jgi:hypothetical protein
MFWKKMGDSEDRLFSPHMDYYKYVYWTSKKWDGKSSLRGKKVLVYAEQGLGDIIQMLRFLPVLKKEGCHITIHVPECLHPVMPYVEGADAWHARENPDLPSHDVHLLLMTIPFIFGCGVNTEPYLKVPVAEDLSEHSGFKVGIAWECSPTFPLNILRCCPLKHYKTLKAIPDVKLFCLQDKIHRPELLDGFDEDIFASELKNWLDTAKLVNSLDAVVSIDTSVLHLAGAMGKKTAAIFASHMDYRWKAREWYDNMKIFERGNGSWEDLFLKVVEYLVK